MDGDRRLLADRCTTVELQPESSARRRWQLLSLRSSCVRRVSTSEQLSRGHWRFSATRHQSTDLFVSWLHTNSMLSTVDHHAGAATSAKCYPAIIVGPPQRTKVQWIFTTDDSEQCGGHIFAGRVNSTHGRDDQMSLHQRRWIHRRRHCRQARWVSAHGADRLARTRRFGRMEMRRHTDFLSLCINGGALCLASWHYAYRCATGRTRLCPHHRWGRSAGLRCGAHQKTSELPQFVQVQWHRADSVGGACAHDRLHATGVPVAIVFGELSTCDGHRLGSHQQSRRLV